MRLTIAKKGTDHLRINSVARYIRHTSEAIQQTSLSNSLENEQERSEFRRFTVKPLCGADPIDVTPKVIEAIAQELWKLRGGNDLLNWLEAERLFAETMRKLSGETDSPSTRRSRATGLRPRSHRRRLQSHVRSDSTALAKSTHD